MKKYSVLIGRFQPIHVGHIHVIKTALENADELIILIGSHNEAPSLRNPFTSKEREEMIRIALAESGIDQRRVHISVVENYTYNDDRWVQDVNSIVNHLIWKEWRADSTEILFVGPKKESDPDLKKFFPTWGKIDVLNPLVVNATDIRTQIFEDNERNKPGFTFVSRPSFKYNNLTNGVSEYIKTWMKKEETSKILLNEYDMVKEYKKGWKPGGVQTFYTDEFEAKRVQVQVGPPYPVIFQTVDAVVTQAGHVLMVTRGAAPGEGLLALPGGFLNPDETLEDGCIRELREETKIKVPDPVLRGSIKWSRTFDDPHRSARGRTITHAFHISLEPTDALPKVKGSDDAIKAQWIPMDKLDGTKIFEDHLQIIRTMAGIK